MGRTGCHHLDAGAGGLGDAQPVQRRQRDQRVLTGRAETAGEQQRTELITIQPGRMRLIIEPRPPDLSRRRVIEEVLLDGVPVEPGNSAQPP
jgi:hypothetical protein